MKNFKVITDYPVATDAIDHFDREKDPSLCLADFDNPAFNKKLYGHFSGVDKLCVLDLGCSTGGFVKSVLDDGHIAIGLEGSDWYLKHLGKTKSWDNHPNPAKRGVVYNVDDHSHWHEIPDNLATCDIGKKFTLTPLVENKDGMQSTLLFHAITAWEVMEHIPESKVDMLFENIANHLTDDGLFICSVSLQMGHYHVTIKRSPWWQDKAREHGLVHNPRMLSYFGHDWVRGPRQAAPGSFHLVFSHA